MVVEKRKGAVSANIGGGIVVDEDVVVLPLDHPFVPGGRFASLLIRDAELARDLAHGFEELWRKAMRNLQEINFDPRRPQEHSSGA